MPIFASDDTLPKNVAIKLNLFQNSFYPQATSNNAFFNAEHAKNRNTLNFLSAIFWHILKKNRQLPERDDTKELLNLMKCRRSRGLEKLITSIDSFFSKIKKNRQLQ
jgi:hypothetical protein